MHNEYRSDVLGSYNSTTSSESSIKFIDEDSSMRNSIILETSAEIHPIPASPPPPPLKNPKPILAKSSLRVKRRPSSTLIGASTVVVDRHQQTTSSKEDVVKSIIVPTLKVEKGSSSTLSTPRQKCTGLNEVVKDSWHENIIHRTSSPISSVNSLVSSLRSEDAMTGSDISSILGPDKEHVLSEKMHHIVSNFRNRAFSVRQRLEEAPSPEDESVLSEEDEQSLPVNKTIKMNQEADHKGLLEKLTE